MNPHALLHPDLIEIGRKAIEDQLVEFRDSRIGVICGNGFTIRERDGSPSDVIRLQTAMGLEIALEAMLDALEKRNDR